MSVILFLCYMVQYVLLDFQKTTFFEIHDVCFSFFYPDTHTEQILHFRLRMLQVAYRLFPYRQGLKCCDLQSRERCVNFYMLTVSLKKNFCPFTCLFARVSLSPLCLFLSMHLVLCRRFRKNTMATLLKLKLIRWQVLRVHLFVAADRVFRSHFILDFQTISKCFYHYRSALLSKFGRFHYDIICKNWFIQHFVKQKFVHLYFLASPYRAIDEVTNVSHERILKCCYKDLEGTEAQAKGVP